MNWLVLLINLLRVGVVILLSTILLSTDAKAGHVSGMNVSYECLGGDSYLVSVNLFRDCYEVQPLPDLLSVFVKSTCNTVGYQDVPLVWVEDVSQLCAAEMPNSSCNGGVQPGVQLGVYQTIIDLEPCIDWTIIVTEQNRDEAIVNLQNPELGNLHVEAFLDNSAGDCNNSPALTVLNLPYVCVGTPLFYNLGFTDIDGDSLVYSFVPAQSSLTPIDAYELVYTGTYSGAEPLTGITIDAQTGQIEVTPTMIGAFNAVVEVQEFRDGALIGIVRHDFLFLVNACAIPPPVPVPSSLQNISGGAYPVGENLIGICEGDDFCFQIDFISTDPSVNVALTSNIETIIPGATETLVGTNPATIEFCGTIPPGFTDGSFLISALDDACPIYGQAYYAVEFVFRQPIEAFGDIVLCEGVVADVYALNDTAYTWMHPNGDLLLTGAEASCNPCQYNSIVADTTAWYTVVGQYANSSCSNRDSVFIEVPLDMEVMTAGETCNGNDGQIVIDVLSGSGDYDINWFDLGPGPLSRTDLVEGNYQVLIIDEVYGCSKIMSFDIVQMTMPVANAGADVEICGLSTNLAANPSSGVGTWTPLTTGVFNDPAIDDPEVSVATAGVHDFIWTENSGGGCVDSDTVRVSFYDDPNLTITAPDSICGLETPVVGGIENGTFTWSASVGISISGVANADVVATNYGLAEIEMMAVNGVCTELLSHDMFFVEAPITSVLADFSICDSLADITGDESIGSGLWALPSNVNSAANLGDEGIDLEADVYGNYELIRYSQNLDFCFDSDTVQVRFVEQPIVLLEDDLMVCDNQIETNFDLPIGVLNWELTSGIDDIATVQTPTLLQGDYGSHTAILHADNGYGCIDSDTLNVTLIEQPVVAMTTADTICGLSSPLVADGTADLAFWLDQDDAQIADPNGPNTFVNVDFQDNFTFSWVMENGGFCRDTAHYDITFYNQPVAYAGDDVQYCGLTTNLEAVPTSGDVLWSPNGNITYADNANPFSQVTADWYGSYDIELVELNGICQSVDTVNIEFISQPQILNESWNCTGADAMYALTFDVAYGDTTMYQLTGVNGNLNDFTFESAPYLSDTPIEVVFYDQGLCGGDTLTGTLFCPVITDAGQMAPDTIHICQSAMAVANFSELFALDLTDTLLYALHTSQNASLGTILSWNDVPEFPYTDTYDLETVYFISAVAGNEQNGAIDLADPYLSVAAGTPVVFHEEPQAIISGDFTACPNEALFIPVELFGVFPQILTYDFNGTQTSVEAEANDLEIQVADSGIYTLVNVSTAYCAGAAQGSVQVSYFGIPSATLQGPPSICANETATLEVNISGESSFGFDVSRDGNIVDTYNSDANQLTFDVNQGGTYQIVNLTDAHCGQNDTATFFLLVNPLPTLDAGDDINICSGDTVLLGTEAIFGQTYAWDNASELLESSGAQVRFTTINSSPFGEDYQTILHGSLNGCTDTDTVQVSVYQDPVPHLVGAETVCSGDSLSLIGIGGDVTWSPSQYFSDDDAEQTFFYSNSDVEITLTVTSQFGCVAEVSQDIFVLASPSAHFTLSENTGCVPFEVDAHALFDDSDNIYYWKVDYVSLGGTSSTESMLFTEAGSFDVSLQVLAPNGCSDFEQYNTTVEAFSTYAHFTFDDSNLDISNPEVYFTNGSPTGVSSFWTIDTLTTSDSRNLFYQFPEELGYEYQVCLDVISPEGCVDSFCDEVEVADDFFIYVPNSFTPNADGINDLFGPVLAFEDLKEYHFWINDSKGNVVFDTREVGVKWDGSIDNSDYFGENTMYHWHLVVKPDFSVETQYFSGHVFMLR